MKKEIASLLFGAVVAATKPAAAMIEDTNEGEKQSQTVSKHQVSPEIKQQIKNVGRWADALIKDQEKTYLILGSANTEGEVLQDQSKAKNWVFWNLSSHEGGKSDPNLNAFIDADFNDKDILQYASKQLKSKFTEIVIPGLVLEYIQWKLPEFALWHNMLTDHGALTFDNFDLYTRHPVIKKVLEELLLSDTINRMNGFDLPYEERDQYLANTYQIKTPGFLTLVTPFFKASDKTLDLSALSLGNNEEKVTEYVNSYLQLVNDPEYKDMEFAQASWKLYNKVRIDLPHLRSLMSDHFFKKLPFCREEEAREYFRRDMLLNDINSKVSSAYSAARESWLKREFSKIFSEVRFEENDKNNTPLNDIPSTSMKRGDRLIYLRK